MFQFGNEYEIHMENTFAFKLWETQEWINLVNQGSDHIRSMKLGIKSKAAFGSHL